VLSRIRALLMLAQAKVSRPFDQFSLCRTAAFVESPVPEPKRGSSHSVNGHALLSVTVWRGHFSQRNLVRSWARAGNVTKILERDAGCADGQNGQVKASSHARAFCTEPYQSRLCCRGGCDL